MNKQNLLIVENSIDVTGALKSITRTAYDLRDYYNFHFLIPKNSKSKAWIEGKGFYTNYELPMKEISRRLTSLVSYFPYLFINAIRLNMIIKKNSIALIHLNDLYNLLPIVIRLFGNTTPYVCHIRFMPDRFPSWLFRFWLKLHLKYAKNVIAVSKSVLRQLPAHPKIVLIYNELPVEERYPDLPRPDLDKTTFDFLYLSNFMRGKGQNFAVEAFAMIQNKLPNWKLRFVGGDMGMKKNKKFRDEVQKMALKLGIFEKTEWLDYTEAVEFEYKKADIVLNFSESESFSITCLEALYFGRPLIATDCGGPSEIIDHGESGFLINNRNVYAMSTAMLLLAQEKELRIKFSEEGMNRSRERFSKEKTSYRLLAIYNLLLLKGV